jgi:hypothetical protein
MSFVVIKAFSALMLFDLYITRNDFAALHAKVRNCPVRRTNVCPDTIERICAAVEMASIWYWKNVLCLQRSAATVWMLRYHGISAELVIGAQQIPFRAHAWVEVNGCVVNDKLDMRKLYDVLDRC